MFDAVVGPARSRGLGRAPRPTGPGRARPLVDFRVSMATTERDLLRRSSASSASATDAEIKSAFRQARPAVASRRQQGARGRGPVQGDQRGLPGPVRPGAPPALRHVRASRVDGGPRAAGLRGLRRLRRHLRRVLRRRRGRARRGAAGRSAGSDLRYDLRITFEEAINGTEKEIEFPVARRAARRAAATAPSPGTEPIDLPAVQRPRRGPQRPPDDARPDGQRQRPARAARARARSSRRRATTCHGEGRVERKRTLQVTIPPGIDEGHQIRLSNEGEAGPRGGPAGSCTSPSTSRRTRRSSATGTELYLRGRRRRSPRRRSARRITVPDRRGRGGGRDQAGHAARAPRSGCAARACPTSAGRVSAATFTSSSTSRSRRKLTKRAARGCSRPTPTASGEIVTEAAACSSGSATSSRRCCGDAEDAPDDATRDRRPSALARARGRGGPRGRRGRQRDPRAGRARAARASSPAFDLVDEGLGARIDPTRPATVRAYVPARDRARRIARPSRRVAEALGHLQAFGLRPIGELQTRVVDEADWADAWKAHFPVLRLGRRLVIRPSWRTAPRDADEVVIALDPGMAFGTGLHPTTRLCLEALERRRRSRPARRGPRPRCRLRLGHPLDRRGSSSARRRVLGVDTDPIAVEATARECPPQRPRAPPECAPEGSLPTGEAPFDVVLANLIAGLLVALASSLHAELVPGGTLVASGIFIDREARGPSGVRGRRPARHRANGRRRLGGARGSEGPEGRRWYDRPDAEPPDPDPASSRTSRLRSCCSCRRSCCPSRCARGARPSTPTAASCAGCCWGQSHGTVIIGAGLAITGLGLVAALGPTLLQQPWLLIALAIYAFNLGLAFFIQRPNLRRLIGVKATPDDEMGATAPGVSATCRT